MKIDGNYHYFILYKTINVAKAPEIIWLGNGQGFEDRCLNINSMCVNYSGKLLWYLCLSVSEIVGRKSYIKMEREAYNEG